MRLFEITQPTYYLHTKSKQPIGGTTVRLGSVYPLGASLENQLEQRRPSDQLPRTERLYLSLTSDGDALHIYEIAPIGQVDRHHTSWLRKLEVATNSSEWDCYAGGYWSAREIPEMRSAPFEHRALEVKVIRRVGGTARIRPS